MKKTLMLLSAGFILAATSCKKDDDCDLNTGNFAGTYKISSVKYKANSSTPEADITSVEFDACELDNLHKFNSGGVYSYQVAGTACSPEDDNYNDTWSLSGSTVTVEGESSTVSSFSCNGFSISDNDVLNTGDTYTINFVKQ
ncbi:MAG: hypothetical protein H7Y86_07320 [Rhizobacter sp.]|nr:hypothetical protein [Ferruginibacter sp.]